jgi:5-methylcytosine-specific restriction protein A
VNPREPRVSAYRRGYTKKWSAYSRRRLQAFPLCGMRSTPQLNTQHSCCAREGRVAIATVTDHIVPHRGDQEMFWNPENHQSLCESCHNAKSRSERA